MERVRESVVKKIGQDQSQQALSKVVRGKMMGGKLSVEEEKKKSSTEKRNNKKAKKKRKKAKKLKPNFERSRRINTHKEICRYCMKSIIYAYMYV